MKQIAKDYFELGLNPVPVKSGTKIPARMDHPSKITEEEVDNLTWDEIGISTGYASSNLEALDFDLKNAEDPQQFLQDYKDLVGEDLLKKLVIQETPSGGYHFIYRCDIIESSQKLAKNEEGHAILETRGLGGYIKCYPSEGYVMRQHTFSDVPYITSEERFNLFISGRKLNKLIKEDNKLRVPQDQRDYQSKFPDYDSDPEIGIQLLEETGWTEHSRIADWVNFTRPGKGVEDGLSGGYNLDGNFFFAFSTSQDNFVTERPYSNHQIYAELVCGGDYRKAYAKLFEDGQGDESIEVGEDLDFLSNVVEENDYLEQARKGEIEHGLSTGWDEIDKYFRFKKNTLNMGLGFENIGKSVFASSLMSASSILHDWTWGMLAPENRNPVNRRRSIESLSGKTIKQFNNSPAKYNKYLDYSRSKLKIVQNKKHYTITEGIEIAKRLYEYEGIDAMLIEPFNFFKVEGNAYDHRNRILSELRVFVESYCSVYLFGHPFSDAARTNMDKEGYMTAPNRYQIEGGATTSFRVDDFFVAHRITNHPSPLIRKSMQFIVEKIKEYDTGGMIHDKGDYTELIWEVRDGFLGYWDESGNNPMYKSMLAQLGLEKLTQSGLGDRI